MQMLIGGAREPVDGRDLDRKVGAATWGLFFTWGGLSLLGNVGWGVALLGAGLIALGVQASRRYMALRVESFWIVTGILFAAGGISNLLGATVDLIPLLFIAAGISLLVAALDDGREARQTG